MNGRFGIAGKTADDRGHIQPRLGSWPQRHAFRIMLLNCEFLDRGIKRVIQFMSYKELHTIATRSADLIALSELAGRVAIPKATTLIFNDLPRPQRHRPAERKIVGVLPEANEPQ